MAFDLKSLLEKQEMKKTYTCHLLLNTQDYLATQAENFCKTLFDVQFVTRSDRSRKKLPETIDELEPVDFIFNFLSPLKVPSSLLAKAKIAPINFHPAPPSHPGVGCASYALYEALSGGKWEYGVTAHLMEESYDAGTILKTLYFPINKGDYCDTLFDRSIDYTLLLFYDLLNQIAEEGKICPNGEVWKKRASTRKEFEKWMTLSLDDGEEEIEKKIRATRHSRFYGPYLQAFNERFALPPRSMK